MPDTTIFHALGLHMHQPPGNLKLLIDTNAWEAEQIIRCYERAARFANAHRDVGFLHVRLSGILLEQLRDPEIIDRYHRLSDRRQHLPETARRELEQARSLIMEAEISCFLFWGDSWIPHLYERTNPALSLLEGVEQALRTAQATELSALGQVADSPVPTGSRPAPEERETAPATRMREENLGAATTKAGASE